MSASCPNCQTPVAEGHRFCAGCGQPLLSACPACGTAVSLGFKFCSACGSALEAGAGQDRGKPAAHEGAPATPPASQPAAPAPYPAGHGRPQAQGQSGDRRVVTVLFTDVSGFTSMSEKLDPEEVTDVINAFFRVLTEPIYQYGGVVDKYIGDAIMALFGAPIAHEDDPARAVMASWAMQKAAKVFADTLEAKTGIRLKVRIGLNTGLVVAGTVGGQQRQDYTVIGDTVNLAQRMESNAPVGGILVTHETFRQTRHLFEFSARDPVQVKGRSEPVLTYEVVRPLPQPHLTARPRAPLVGRLPERDRILGALCAAGSGIPQLAEIVGDAGTGKTRLAIEACEQASVRPLVARCQSFQVQVPYALMARLLEDWLDLPSERSPDLALERLRAALADMSGVADLERAVVFLAHILHPDIETPELAALSPQQRRSALFKALSDLLFELARRDGRLVVLVDDLQWADEPSRQWLPDFLQYAVASAEGSSVQAESGAEPAPVAILAACRPGEGGAPILDVAGLARTRVDLRPLGDADARRLLAALLDLPEDTARWPADMRQLSRSVLARAEGNPYFLEELVAGLVDGGVLSRNDKGGWTAKKGGAVTLPPTVNGVVASRLDRLPPSLRSTMQTASVLGRTFSLEMLGRLRPGEEHSQHLPELERGGFVTAAGAGEYAFAQAIVQEVAYASMLLSARKDLHLRAAQALEEANLLAPEPLARHWTLAGERGKAARYFALAGDQARHSFANAEAIEAYKQALAFLEELPESPEEPSRPVVLRCLAEVETIAGDPDTALEHLEAAIGASADPLESARIHQARGGAFERMGQFPTALGEYQAAMVLLAGASDATEVAASIRIDTAFLHFRLGDQARCITLCTEALDLLKDGPNLHDRAMAHSILGLCLFQQSRYAEAAQHHRYALSLREQAEDWYGVASSRNNLGLIGSHTAAWGEAVGHFMAALDGFTRVGDLGKVSLVEGNLGMLLCRQGNLEKAESHLRHALDIHQRSKNQFGIGSTLAMLGLVSIEGGKAQAALPMLSLALEGFEATGAAEQQAEIHQLLGRAHLDTGSLDAAAPALARALDLARQSGEKLQEGVASRLLARLELERGDVPAAVTRIEQALALLEPTGNDHELARGLVDAGAIWNAAGRQAEAGVARDRARGLFEALGAVLDLARIEVPA